MLYLFKNKAGSIRRIGNSRLVLRVLYYTWIAFPYPIRKPLTALFILWTLAMKKATGVDRNDKPTSVDDLGNLSFWGVPKIDLRRYTLEIAGEVGSPLSCTFDELITMESVERPVRMDCVGGFRNNSTMRGIPLKRLFDLAKVQPVADSAVFHCADDYQTAHLISDLLKSDAFMAFEINGERIAKFGFPMRLVALGTYGYKWPKWVTKIELVKGFPEGIWERKGLPKRGKIGDIW